MSDEARDRVRAMSLWLVTAVVLVGVGVGLYAVLVGFDRVRPAPVTRVATTADRDLVVEYLGGSPGCGDPYRVDVRETGGEVVLSARVVLPHGTRMGMSCDDEGVPMIQSVRLAAPLADRTVKDASRPTASVPVADSAADLLDQVD